MKTLTEFTSIEMKEALNMRQALLDAKRKEKKQPPAATQPPAPRAATTTNAEPTSETAPVEPGTTATEPAQTPAHAEPIAMAEPTQATVEAKPVSKDDIVIKSPDELLIIRQEERRKEWEDRLNEIKEPLLTQMKEKFKWSDERAEHAFSALDTIFRKRLDDLRAIRILKMEKDTEKVPSHGKKIGELVYITEYYPSQAPERKFDDRKKRDRFKGKKGKRPFPKNKDGMEFGKKNLTKKP